MSDTVTFGLPEAAHRLGVPVRVLRRAMRTGALPAPPHLTATTALTAEWLAGAEAAVAASPKILSRTFHEKAPAFARYQGTSAWRKYAARAREYAQFRAVPTRAAPPAA